MGRPTGGYVTLAQVAKQAGVSLATASRVINGGDRVVGAELRDRVLRAAHQLRYVPNVHAQALAGGASPTVGLIMHDISDPYFAQIVRGAMRVAADAGVLVMLGSTFREPRRELEYVSALRAQRAKALLLVGSGFADPGYLSAMGEELAEYRRAGGRHAFVSRHQLPGDAVLPDNQGGGAQVGRALLELGHREIAVVAGPMGLTTVIDRLDGFFRALAEHGIARERVRVLEVELTEEGGAEAARALVAEGSTATALFCVTDMMAIGALTALRELDVAVPGRLSLVGFGDIPIARHLTPSLSTVALDMEEMGAEAMRMVLGSPAPDPPRAYTVPSVLTLRASTSTPPR
jgi:LacI family transcriptional regulator